MPRATHRRTKGAPKALHDRLDRFLARRVLNDHGGWTPVERRDIQALWGLIDNIVNTKWALDVDHDSSLNISILDRTRFGPDHWLDVPYEHKDPQGSFEAKLGNAKTALEALDLTARVAGLYRREMEKAAKDNDDYPYD